MLRKTCQFWALLFILGPCLSLTTARQALRQAPPSCPDACCNGTLITAMWQAAYDDLGCKMTFIDQKLDHFNASDPRTFKQKLITCDDAWPTDPSLDSAVFVYVGNEGPIEPPAPARPVIFENARRYNALVLQLEHRYYGDSTPFGAFGGINTTTAEYRYLSMEQAMEDTRAVVAAVRAERGVPAEAPTILFGGSYGGQLVAYHCLTYPDDFAAVLASSAPVKYVLGALPLEAVENYHKIVAQSMDIHSGSLECSKTVRSWFDRLHELGKTPEGRVAAATSLRLCEGAKELPSWAAVISLTLQFYKDWYFAVQLNGFTGTATLNGVADACAAVAAASAAATALGLDPLAAMSAMGRWFDAESYDKVKLNAKELVNDQNGCYDYTFEGYTVIPPPGEDSDTAAYEWQCCTQGNVLSEFFPSTGAPGTLLPAYQVGEDTIRADCERLFGPDLPPMKPLEVATNFGQKLKETGGVVFTNGGLDQWSAGSITEAPADVNKTTVVVYAGGAHTTDTATNYNNTCEPPEWKGQRAEAVDAAMGWARGGGAPVSAARAAGFEWAVAVSVLILLIF